MYNTNPNRKKYYYDDINFISDSINTYKINSEKIDFHIDEIDNIEIINIINYNY
jgi:hypothetical protein